MFRIISNSDFAFQRLALELSGYYLLGFEPSPGDRNGRPHDISVGVRRNGVTVRSRRQFTIDAGVATDRRSAKSSPRCAIRCPPPRFPIKLAAYSFRDPNHEKLRLLIAAEIDRSINPDAQLSAGYVVVDFDGKHVASQMDTPMPDTARRDGSMQRYFSTVLADPGKYTVKFVVVDETRRGSVELRVDAQLNAGGPIRATDLLLADGVGRAGDAAAGARCERRADGQTPARLPRALRRRGETLEQVERHARDRAAGRAGSRSSAFPMALRRLKETVRCRVARRESTSSRLPPGNYVARAVIAVGLDAVGRGRARPFTNRTRGSRPVRHGAPAAPRHDALTDVRRSTPADRDCLIATALTRTA